MTCKPMPPRRDNLATLQRRRALTALAAAPAALAPAIPARANAGRPPTPAQSLGPFYPRNAAERPRETDADLVATDGDRILARGQPLHLSGRVVDRRGQPLADARVEIWQCDANAVYHHPDGGAASERDPHFQGYGETRTDAGGEFHFRTIRPVPYPGRTPHIHVRVAAAGRRPLATQLYLDDAPENRRDFLYRQLDADEQRALTLALRPSDSDHPLARGTRLAAQVELVLA